MSGQFFFGTPDHNISAPFEIDAYPVNLVGGVSYTAYIAGASEGAGTLNDPAVFLLDHNGNVIGGQDTSTAPIAFGNDPVYQFDAPATGSYYIAVTDLHGGTGTYTPYFSESGPPVSF